MSGDGCSSDCKTENEYFCQYDGVKSICSKNTKTNDFSLEPIPNPKYENPVIFIIFDFSLQNSSSETLQ